MLATRTHRRFLGLFFCGWGGAVNDDITTHPVTPIDNNKMMGGRMWLRLSRAMGRKGGTSPATIRFQSSSTRIISYMTDIEGDGDYLDRYVEQSRVLEHKPRSASSSLSSFLFPYDTMIDFTTNHAHLVHGGDVWDKGGRDLYCIRQLLDLKRRHPDRVHFLMGNRDIHKMRILPELGLDDMKTTLPMHGGAYWLRGTGRMGDPNFGPAVPHHCPVERLEWMMTHTMGCPNTMELRRLELESLSSSSSSSMTPQDVVESYRQTCHPLYGEMGLYLSQAHLAHRMGNTLFLHGSLPLTNDVLLQYDDDADPTEFWKDCAFAMPWRGQHHHHHHPVTAHEWIHELNVFANQNVEAWKQDAKRSSSSSSARGVWATVGGFDYWPDDNDNNSYGGLLQFALRSMPNERPTPTVVCTNWLGSNGMPTHFYPGATTKTTTTFADLTSAFMEELGLQLILTGHKPVGDTPLPIRVGHDKWILSCDTSYSGDVEWLPGDDNDAAATTTTTRGTNAGRGNSASARGDVCVW